MESSLSRVYRHNENHDCGAITAFRGSYTKKENAQRNKSLMSKLLMKGYSLTKVSGRYLEDDNTPVVEISFFVVDVKDKGNIKEDLFELGKEFDQDSVFILPKGTVDGKDKSYLLGTNTSFGIGKVKYFNGTGKFGYSDSFYVSYVNGRPFYMDKLEEERVYKPSGMSLLVVDQCSKMDWRDIKINDEDTWI